MDMKTRSQLSKQMATHRGSRNVIKKKRSSPKVLVKCRSLEYGDSMPLVIAHAVKKLVAHLAEEIWGCFDDYPLKVVQETISDALMDTIDDIFEPLQLEQEAIYESFEDPLGWYNGSDLDNFEGGKFLNMMDTEEGLGECIPIVELGEDTLMITIKEPRCPRHTIA